MFHCRNASCFKRFLSKEEMLQHVKICERTILLCPVCYTLRISLNFENHQCSDGFQLLNKDSLLKTINASKTILIKEEAVKLGIIIEGKQQQRSQMDESFRNQEIQKRTHNMEDIESGNEAKKMRYLPSLKRSATLDTTDHDIFDCKKIKAND